MAPYGTDDVDVSLGSAPMHQPPPSHPQSPLFQPLAGIFGSSAGVNASDLEDGMLADFISTADATSEFPAFTALAGSSGMEFLFS